MGIPRLATRIRQFATYRAIGRSGDCSDQKQAVIDGPAFVWHVHWCLRRGARSEDELSPLGYADYCASTLSQLADLERHGFEICAIVFDGALPDYKKEERVDRLRQQVRRLVEVKQESIEQHKERHGGHPPRANKEDLVAIDPAKLATIAPSFMIPAVMEALLESKYASITYSVPGEADNYCALEGLGQPNAIIFTNDSDLLLYNVGPQTQVAMLNSVDERGFHPNTVLEADVYHPDQLARRFGMDRLTEAAFLMHLDPYVSFQEAAAKVRDNCEHVKIMDGFHEFAERYELPLDLESVKSQAVVDARLSELVHQISQQHTSIDMFMPGLTEDPSKQSGWNIGADIRQLAYSIITNSSPGQPRAQISEYIRKGDNVAPNYCTTPSTKDLEHHILQWTAFLETSQETTELASPNNWRYVGLSILMNTLKATKKPLPAVEDAVQVLEGQPARTWRDLHLRGQLQAALYSLRLLRQALDVVSRRVNVELASEMSKLQQLLGPLPALAPLMEAVLTPRDQARFLSEVKGLYKSLGVSV